MLSDMEVNVDRAGKRVRGEELGAQWQARLERFGKAGRGVREFCAAESVSEARFFYWRRRLATTRSGDGAVALVKRRRPARFVDAGVAQVAPVRDRSAAICGAAAGGLELQIDLGAGLVVRIVRR